MSIISVIRVICIDSGGHVKIWRVRRDLRDEVLVRVHAKEKRPEPRGDFNRWVHHGAHDGWAGADTSQTPTGAEENAAQE